VKKEKKFSKVGQNRNGYMLIFILKTMY